MASSPSMLTKFESKSSRAKGIAFHPKRPWILVSLHSSTIQLWDYRMGTLIDRFEEHDGPVRGIDFHKTQPLFVSGGDDYKIKVWSYQTRRCLFTLNGHLDYVRTVFFHHELPWIVSSSDDQTIRIWNWQNRSLICTMTGHNHYTMCAQFHPKEDLIVSASLDQSVRVWDISGLRKKHSAPTSMSFEDQMARANQQQADMFGNTDAVVKFVLEGHDRGVNWVAFHPTLPLIVSAGDDRLVKLWRMSETKAWEVDTCRGHFQNASACLFHPHQDLILSVGEDKTVRVWDLNKRTSVQSFKRENDRFWVIAAHPEINLFAAGHDNGVMVFKLERERPASSVYQNQVFYITKDKQVRSYDFSKNIESQSMLSLRKFGSTWVPPRTLSYNPAERSVLVTSPADNGSYELIALPKDAAAASDPTDIKRGQGNSAVFVARNRFAVFNVSSQLVEIKDLSNSTTKSFKAPYGTTDITFGGTGCLLLITPSTVVLYDIQQKKQLAELGVTGVKYVSWSNDGLYAALLSKHNVTIVTKTLEQVSTLHETIRIKSATWDDSGVLLYSTLNHIKYTLLNGDNGIVRTLDQTVYLIKVKARSVYCMDRAAKPKVLTIDPTEYRFKLALVKRNYDEMLQIIKTSSLVGQSIISYLQKKGYPEIALQFVQDPQTRFELALECGNLDVATEMAKELDRPKIWTRLGTEALSHGNHQTVEMTYQKLRNFDKLSFLYLCTGDEEKLTRMAKIAEHRGDFVSRFQNALYLGDVESRIQMFKEIDLYPLAYLTAKTHGLTEECESILEASGLSEDQISMPTSGNPIAPPRTIVQTHKANWPVKEASHSSFEKALLGETGAAVDDAPEPELLDEDLPVIEQKNGLPAAENEEEAGDGWDMGDDIAIDTAAADSDFVNVDNPDAVPEAAGPGSSEADMWSRNSPLAADHVAAGSFDTAMQLLNRQVGAVEFAPLKPRFVEIFQASKTFLPAAASLPPLINYNRRTIDETDTRKLLPRIPRDLETINTVDMQEGFTAMRTNKLESGVLNFKSVLQSLLVNVVSSQAQVSEAKAVITKATDYALAMSTELERRKLSAAGGESEEQLKRQLELSAYFTVPKMDVGHRQLALMAAMKLAFSNKQFSSALSFANRVLANGGAPKLLDQAKKVKAQAERSGSSDKIDIDFDPFADFDVCAASYTPIYGGSPSVACPYDGAKYHSQYKGQVCKICEHNERKTRKDRLWTRRDVEDQIANGRKIVIFDGRVLKADSWIQYHPGGEMAILHMIGRDGTDEIRALHSAETQQFMQRFVVGRIEGRWENFIPPVQGGEFVPKAEQEPGNETGQESEHSSSSSSSTAPPTPIFDAVDADAVGRRRRKYTDATSLSSASSISLSEEQLKTSAMDARTESEISSDLLKYPSLDSASQDDIIRKYRALEQQLRAAGLFDCPYYAYGIECIRYLALFAAFVYFLKTQYFFFSAVSLGLLWHQLVFTVHDAGHMGITHSFHGDTTIGIIIADFIGGLSVCWWKHNHNVHHIVTNSPEHDPDIEHLPFLAISHRFFDSLKSTYYNRIMDFDAVARFTVQYQDYMYYPLLLFGRFNLYILSWSYLLSSKPPRQGPAWWHRYLELAGQAFFWTWFGYFTVYRSIPSAGSRIIFVLVSHMVTAPLHVQITLSHFAMSTADLGPNESFPQKMLRTTMDVTCPAWLDFVHGGLQFQAIHHLYPRMPRHNLRRAQPYVMKFCKEVKIPYTIYGFLDGNKEVIGRLGEIGRQVKVWEECRKVAAKDLIQGKDSF